MKHIEMTCENDRATVGRELRVKVSERVRRIAAGRECWLCELAFVAAVVVHNPDRHDAVLNPVEHDLIVLPMRVAFKLLGRIRHVTNFLRHEVIGEQIQEAEFVVAIRTVKDRTPVGRPNGGEVEPSTMRDGLIAGAIGISRPPFEPILR